MLFTLFLEHFWWWSAFRVTSDKDKDKKLKHQCKLENMELKVSKITALHEPSLSNIKCIPDHLLYSVLCHLSTKGQVQMLTVVTNSAIYLRFVFITWTKIWHTVWNMLRLLDVLSKHLLHQNCCRNRLLQDHLSSIYCPVHSHSSWIIVSAAALAQYWCCFVFSSVLCCYQGPEKFTYNRGAQYFDRELPVAPK